jgi:hypothetical protein
LYNHPLHYTSVVREGRCHSLALCHPLPSFLHTAPLEKGPQCPRGAYDHQPGARPGQRRDARRTECVLSVTSDLVRPSRALCRHPRHCRAIPDTVGTYADETSPRQPLFRPSSRCTDNDQTRVPAGPPSKLPFGRHSTGLTTTHGRTKIHQDNHQITSIARQY